MEDYCRRLFIPSDIVSSHIREGRDIQKVVAIFFTCFFPAAILLFMGFLSIGFSLSRVWAGKWKNFARECFSYLAGKGMDGPWKRQVPDFAHLLGARLPPGRAVERLARGGLGKKFCTVINPY